MRGDEILSLVYGYGSGGPLAVWLVGRVSQLVYFGGLGATIRGPTVIGRFAIVTLDSGFGGPSQLLGFDLERPRSEPDPLGSCPAAWSASASSPIVPAS